jgi:hypothetical protein
MPHAARRICCALTLGASALALLALAGCGGGAARSEGSHQRARPAALGLDRRLAVRVVHRCRNVDWSPSSSRSYAVVARRATLVRAHPRAGERVVGRFQRKDENGYPTVFAVLDARVKECRPVWYRVELPSLPNGSTGWVRAADVRAYRLGVRVVVDLSDRRASVYRWGRLAFRAPVAVGAPGTPTPVGRFFVDERFLLSSADGPFGVAALGISAHSDVLHDWVQGGPIALHGTNDPAAIGLPVSHGCIRLRNADMTRLFGLVSAGTPVLVRR